MSDKVRVPVEVDITYVNKKWFTKRPQKNDKHYVIGFYQRHGHGTAIIDSIPDNKPETIHASVLKNVAKGGVLFSEENLLPESLLDEYDIYELKESDGHANGDIHVNNVKNMWRDLKRQIKREHIHVSQDHLQGYCNEVAWRITHSHLSPMERFEYILGNLATTPKLPYKKLIKK